MFLQKNDGLLSYFSKKIRYRSGSLRQKYAKTFFVKKTPYSTVNSQ